MEIVETISGCREITKGCVLTIGNFDGVHLGHQEILIAARQTAAERRVQLVVMTFEPHPLAVLHPQKRPGILTSLALKKHLLAEFGVDCLFVLESTLKLLSFSPEDFVEEFIVKNIQPGIMVEGESFNFGCGRGGGVRTLQQLGAEKGFGVSVIEAREVKLSTGQMVKVSSTLIRNMLESGRAADAAIALGRSYRLIGQVIPGRGEGKKLGFPTANMEPVRQLIPAEGVYAGFVEIGNSEEEVYAAKQKVPAAFSIGRSETLGKDNPLAIEAHILSDNIGDLHGKWLAMDFVEYIRSQQQFEKESELSAQIARDCEKAKKILATDEHRFH
jgi:riboflavin kinase/FMN adenylyltransferase